jgi:hypothetical protein
MNIIDIPEEKPMPLWKEIYIHISMKMKWNWPITRHIYSWYFRKYNRGFSSFIFPVIKNISYSDFAKDIISVQPMKYQSSTVFYMDFVYKKKKWWQFWKRKHGKS